MLKLVIVQVTSGFDVLNGGNNTLKRLYSKGSFRQDVHDFSGLAGKILLII